MTNYSIFKGVDFSIPIVRPDDDILFFQRSLFEKYFTNLDKFTGRLKLEINEKQNEIRLLSNAILNTLDTYLNGDTIEAYRILEKALNQVKKYLLIKDGITDLESIQRPEEFYKARIGKGILFQRNEMFHIPFEKRYLVTSQRYSLPGIPCLYLSNSTYLCWEELGKPDFDTLQFSRFDLSKEKLRFLNLNHTNDAISFFGFNKDGDLDQMAEFFIFQYLLTWPLQASVSIKVKYPENPFKPEYIIPQLLLQWVVNSKDLDGIRFFSTKSSGTTPILHLGNMSNLVIPIKKSNSKGLCEILKKKIRLTNPLSYEYASLMIPQFTSEKFDKKEIELSMKPFTLKLHEDHTVLYSNTKFGQIERILNQSEAKLLE